MIYNVRTAGMAGGKLNQAMAWAIKVAKWVNGKYPDSNVTVLRNITGNLTQVHWLWTTESLGEYEQLASQLEGDDAYQAMLKEASSEGLFAEDSLRHSFYRTVEG